MDEQPDALGCWLVMAGGIVVWVLIGLGVWKLVELIR